MWFLLACTADLAEDRAFVLLEGDAIEVGWRLVVDDELYAPVLPVVVEAGAPILLEGPSDELELSLEPGELAWVDATGGADLWTLGRDLEEDALLVDGPDDVLEAIAEHADLELDQGPEGLTVLSGPGALVVSELVGQPEDLYEAFPVDLDEAATEGWGSTGGSWSGHAPTAPTIIAEGSAALLGPGAAALGDGRARSGGLGQFGELVGDSLGGPDPRMVGVYDAADRCLTLRLDARWSLCDGSAQGAWTTEGGELVLIGGERFGPRELVRR